MHIARVRNRILRDLAEEKKLNFMQSFTGQKLEAITLNVVSQDSAEIWTEALTDNYLKLRLKGRHGPNQWLKTQIVSVRSSQLVGHQASLG